MSERVRPTFGAGLKQLRLAHRLTQEQLAERCSLAADTVRRVELGSSPMLDTLEKLAAGLGLTPGQLLTVVYDTMVCDDENLGELLDLLRGRPRAQVKSITSIVRAALALLGGPDGVAPGEGEQAPVEAGLPIADGDDLEVLATVDETDARPSHGPGELGCLVQAVHAGADLDPRERGAVALAGHRDASDEVGDPG